MQISETATSQIVDQMSARMRDLMVEISDNEDFEIIASSHKAGKTLNLSSSLETFKSDRILGARSFSIHKYHTEK